MKKSLRCFAGCLLTVVAFACLWGCEDDDFVAPAFLRIDAIVVDTTSDVYITTGRNETTLPGFTTSEVPFCNVYVYYTGRRSAERLGHQEMPFTIPVLGEGDVDSILVYPAVVQSGVYGTQPAFPFFDHICIKKKSAADTLRFVAGDTLSLDTLHTAYNMRYITVHLFEPFERDEGALAFDSVMGWVTEAPDDACGGAGYGTITVPDSVGYVDVALKNSFYVPYTSSTNLYLELDLRSEVPVELFMTSSYTYSTSGSSSSTDTRGVVVLNPTDKWQHFYINLGRTWSWFNHNPSFRLKLTALNESGEGGTARIDNVKLMSSTYLFL